MAADTQVSDTLKKFAVKVTTASVKERKDIFGELKRCIKGKELPEPAIKGLCKLFCLTPNRYRDAASRREVLSVIAQLADSQPDILVTSLLHCLLNSGVVSKNGEPSKSTGSAAFISLSWTCLLVPRVFSAPEKKQGSIWKKMVEVQSLLVAEVVGGAKTTAQKSSLKNLSHLWKENPGLVDEYISTLLSLDQSPTTLAMLGVCLDFCTAQKDRATIEKHKSALLDLYIKSVLMSKTKPHQHILDKSGSFLRHVSHSEFKELLLPALQKTMLRSPENAMQTVSCLLLAVTLDLSQYAMDIGKAIASQLKANNAQLMEQAVQAMQNLAQQCSDPSAVQDIVTHLFKILGGSEGKLTVVAQKMSVLSGIASCSHHAASGTSSQTLSSAVTVMFIPYLQQEVHEATLVHAVSVLSQWSSRLTVEVPTALLDWLKKAFTLKTSTSLVRHAYLQAMLGAFKGDTLAQASDLVPLLLQTVEKAAAQNSQHALLSEGVAASVLLSRDFSFVSAEAKFSSFWNLILDEKKPLFTTEKFLSQLKRLMVLLLCERLLLDHHHRLNTSKSQMYHHATVAVLLSRSWRVRKRAQQTIRKLLSSLGGSSLARGLLGELRVVINKHKVLPQDVLVSESGELTELGRGYIPPRVLLDALCVICSSASQWGDPTEAENLAMEILIVTHHPSIVGARSGLWPFLLLSMNIKAEEFIEKNLEAILPHLLEVNADNQAVKNAVGALSGLSPNKLLPRVISHVSEGLSRPALLQVTREEYAIMRTPEGELYDKSIIQSAQKESTKKANIKRENKAYSYKEQIIELELQEELKKKKGIKEELQLTSKQKEMMQIQLEKEAAIRKRLQVLDVELQGVVGLLEATLKERPPQITRELPAVLQVLIPLLQSPLAAPSIQQVFLDIVVCLMPKHFEFLAVLVGHVTLRLLKPECDLDEAWEQEDLETAAHRTILLLHNHTVPQRDAKNDVAPLSAPAFSVCFPLLNAMLREFSGSTEETENMMTRALQVITVHCQLRAATDMDDLVIDENGPELLPRVSMLLLLTRVIATATPRLQVLASQCLTALCASAGGGEGCTVAEQPEIDVLLNALLSPCFSVRDAALRGLLEMEFALSTDSTEASGLSLLRRLWVCRFDVEEEGRTLAEKLWDSLGLEVVPELCSLLIGDVTHHEEAVRSAAAEALSSAVSQYKDQSATVLGQLTELYHQKLYRPPPVLDALGRVISEAPPDQWEARGGIALALNKLSQYLDESQVTPLFLFFVPDALNDRHTEVRRCMLDAALSALNTHGKDNVSSLLPVFEEFLKDAPQDANYDAVRQSVVILMGSLAKHLDKNDPKVKPIVAKLITALSTPSQQVQESVASCLPPLVPAIKEDAAGIVRNLLQLLLESDKYAERKGAAYGLAGLVKGLGILALKQQDIMTTLTDAIQDKKNFRRREGALFAFEMLCNMLGKLFEPYVVHVLPHLLLCFGDGNQYVREAADDCAKAVMRNLSAHGVKLVLPSLLMALEEESWRTKAGSVELLGAMAFCAPKQLSSCLPSIVPKLTEVLTDSHVKVQKAGQQALRQIGSVIRNPEILGKCPTVIGQSCHDIEGLLPINCLKVLTQEGFKKAYEMFALWLIGNTWPRQSSVDRSGAAQGLAEVMAGLGVEKLDKLMPDVVQTASKVDIASHVRDGYIMMFIYLPLTFGDKFTPYVGPIIPCILKALADENEYVRDTALRAGQRIISMYAETAIALLLPELEQGLFDDLWRIRFSSVQLLGDLLFHISGVTGKMTTETACEDDNFGTAASNKAIIGALGAERRNRVLSGLYMGRSDTQLVVRQASLHVWKIVVSNTPRTLREILPTLFTLLLGFLASTCPDKRTIAARTLGDLVRKLGEKILPEIIPILEEGLRSDKSDERQGVCIGLSEIMKSTSKDAVLVFSESLVPTVRKALCDPLEEVREAAAKTFEQLHATIGHQALDDILPTLLKQLDDEETAEFALDGLKQVMAVKSRSVLPYLVPKLTAPPVNTRVLAFLSAVAGDALTRHLGVILPALLSSLKGKLGTEDEAQELCSCQTVILSVEDEVGQRIIIDDLLEATRGADAGVRQAAVTILNAYFARTRLDYSAHTRNLLSGLIRLLNDSNPEVLSQSWDTINSITKKLDASSQLAMIDDLHRDIRSAAADVKGQHLPGFCLPKKGVTCILPVLREGVLTGSPEQKEEAAKALGGVIKLTSPEALRPSVVNITGPLIRILGDRFAWTVKTALLETLTLLLAKVGIALKPFLPQLQTTFLKALQDSSRGVRLKAAEALGQLVSIHTKVDPLFTEQLSAIRNAEDSGVRETMLQALRFVIQGAGSKVDPTIRKNITTTLLGMLGHDEDATRMASAGCVGELCAFLSEEELKSVLLQHILADVSGVDWMVRHGRSLAMAIAVKSAPEKLCGKEYCDTVTEAILANATADRIPIATSGIRALGYLMRHHLRTEGDGCFVLRRLLSVTMQCLQNQSSDIRLVSERVLWWVFKEPATPSLEANLIKPLLKSLLDNTKDKNTSVRAQSEHTIINLLRLRQGEETMQSITVILDSASNDLLSECHRRSLKKIACLPDSNEEIDDTILT
uniref:GCN1 activator of EIF2AK4 n=1 Tax=Sander lucioperca TaxID=283035 RepID=A0A8D0A2S3_SANLU